MKKKKTTTTDTNTNTPQENERTHKMTNSIIVHRVRSLATPLVFTLLLGGCATTTPAELTNARTAYTRASSGPANRLVPTDVHKAEVALREAERAFADEKNSQKTIDLAYIAERMAQIAEARADAALAEKRGAKATQDLDKKQGEIAKQTQGDLTKTRDQLAASQRGEAQQTEQAGAERSARELADKRAAASDQKATLADQKAADADQRTKEANDALAKLAAKNEERGMVITLSGSVLFRSNESTLMPAALSRLDTVAAALVAKGQSVVIEGYTDSRGSVNTNMNLSRQRAESVRTYLVSRGVPTQTIVARGMGPDRPIAENSTAEGRANNRRVEIVIEKSPARIN